MNTIVQAIMHDQMCDFMLRYSDFKQYTKSIRIKYYLERKKLVLFILLLLMRPKVKTIEHSQVSITIQTRR